MSLGLQIIRPYLRPVSIKDLPKQVLNIGLTGGIGSGKSTIARLLQAHGMGLIDLDQISHALTQTHGRALPEIAAYFGAHAISEDGSLNRSFIRERVFNHPEERQILEKILHPMIAQEALQCAHQLVLSKQCIIYDIPLLAESSTWQDRLDWIVVIESEIEVQIKRVKKRHSQMDEQAIKSIIAAQASTQQRRLIANALVDNRENTHNCLNLVHQVDILTDYIRILCSQKHLRST